MTDDTLMNDVARVRGVRQDVAERVVDAFGSRQAIAAATVDELTAVKGVGQVTAERISDSFTSDAEVTELRPGEERDTSGAPAREAATATPTDEIRTAAGRTGQRAEATVARTTDQARVTYEAVTAGLHAAAETARDRWPEVREAFGDAAGEVVKLGRTVKDSVVTIVTEPLDRAS